MSLDTEAAYGAVIVNWKTRTIDWLGMDGNGNQYTPEDVLAETEIEVRDPDPDVYVGYLIFWKDNDQLCVHDRVGFTAEALGTGDADE